MTNIIWSLTLLVTTASFTQAYQIYNHGNGIVHRLNVVQDVTLELRRNLNYFKELLVARLTYWPLKRSLVQFENLKSSCPAHKIRFAKMYLYFTAAHKASFLSVYQQPYLINTFQVHRVLKPWDERQATIAYRKRGLRWQSVLLNIGKDAEAQPQCGCFLGQPPTCFPTTLYPGRPRGFMEFDVTKALRDWRKGKPNYGLLLKTANEKLNGRDLRFASKTWKNRAWHPHIMVECKY